MANLKDPKWPNSTMYMQGAWTYQPHEAHDIERIIHCKQRKQFHRLRWLNKLWPPANSAINREAITGGFIYMKSMRKQSVLHNSTALNRWAPSTTTGKQHS